MNMKHVKEISLPTSIVCGDYDGFDIGNVIQINDDMYKIVSRSYASFNCKKISRLALIWRFIKKYL